MIEYKKQVYPNRWGVEAEISQYDKKHDLWLLVARKTFNPFTGGIKQKHYDAANKWADEQVDMIKKNSKDEKFTI